MRYEIALHRVDGGYVGRLHRVTGWLLSRLPTSTRESQLCLHSGFKGLFRSTRTHSATTRSTGSAPSALCRRSRLGGCGGGGGGDSRLCDWKQPSPWSLLRSGLLQTCLLWTRLLRSPLLPLNRSQLGVTPPPPRIRDVGEGDAHRRAVPAFNVRAASMLLGFGTMKAKTVVNPVHNF